VNVLTVSRLPNFIASQMSYIFLILAIFFFVIINGGVILWAMSILGSWRAPYVPLPHESLPGIADALRLVPGAVVYDIGCGDGRILRACAAREPNAFYKGVERAWYPYILARMCGAVKNIRYVRGDAFTQSYADANSVVLYLLPGFVDKVAEKLAKECRQGTRIVTADFPITLWKPKEVIEQHQLSARTRGRMLYTYEIPQAP